MLVIKLVLTAILLIGVINPAFSIRISEVWKLGRKPPTEKLYKFTRIYSIVAIVLVWMLM